ncbi:hypothetical protein MSPP1_000813 [Malassezia sp. CBS 17886]|nr:hypothetical protein MSPP1_000813 [Malassezia sp. CBS 17886]
MPDETDRVCCHSGPTLTRQVAIVTGGNAGVGYYTVLALLRKNAKVYLAARSEERAREAIAKLEKEDGVKGSVEWLPLDLASLKSIKQAADMFLQKKTQLDMLFNSAGVLLPKVCVQGPATDARKLGEKTTDGYEIHMGVNALGHYYFTKLLIPALLASAKATPARPPRVCFTSSIAHRWFTTSKGFDPEDYAQVNAWRPVGMPAAARAYGTSKLANVLTANAMKREYGAQGIVFVSANPGNLRTELYRDYRQGVDRALLGAVWRTFLYPQELGCVTQLYAVTAPETAEMGGAYFAPWARRATPTAAARNEKTQDALIQWFNEQIAKHMGSA